MFYWSVYFLHCITELKFAIFIHLPQPTHCLVENYIYEHNKYPPLDLPELQPKLILIDFLQGYLEEIGV